MRKTFESLTLDEHGELCNFLLQHNGKASAQEQISFKAADYNTDAHAWDITYASASEEALALVSEWLEEFRQVAAEKVAHRKIVPAPKKADVEGGRVDQGETHQCKIYPFPPPKP